MTATPSQSGIRVTPLIALRLRRALGQPDLFPLFSTETWEHVLGVAFDAGVLPVLPVYTPIRCSECVQVEGSQHLPSCNRQGIVSIASDARFTGKAADHIQEQAKEIERLKVILRTAPHDMRCKHLRASPCDCWKKDLVLL